MKHFDFLSNRNLLTTIKKIIFLTAMALLCRNVAWAQSLTGGDGSSEQNAYKINNKNDWNLFVSDVNTGTCNYGGKWVQLMTDISISSAETVGVYAQAEAYRKPFCGYFTGNEHTITVRLSNGTANVYTAPFVCVNGAIIKKVTINGNINIASNVGKAAGVIGVSYGATSKIQNNVYVDVNITNGSDGSAGPSCAGVAVDASALEISSCSYKGKIMAGANSAGFCSIGSNTVTKINNCLFDPDDESSISGNTIQNFVANGQYISKNSSNYYYTKKIGTSTQGTRAYKTFEAAAASGDFTQKTQMPEGSYYYVVGTGAVTTNYTSYYQSTVANGGLLFKVTYNGAAVSSSNYTYRIIKDGIEVTNLAAIGEGTHTLEVTGCNDNAGTLKVDFEVYANAGNGTAANPYKIGSTADWNIFASMVNEGCSFDGEYVVLTNNITINIENEESDVIAGVCNYKNTTLTSYKAFKGTFDGNNDTLTFNVGQIETYVPTFNHPTAPFRVIDGATIKNLTVNGTIKSKYKYLAGFAGFAFGSNNFDTCTSSVVIDCSELDNGDLNTTTNYKRWDCSAAGFVAEGKKNSPINFVNCIFDGSIERGDNIDANRGAGFVSYNGNKINYTNSYMVGLIDLNSTLSVNYGSVSTFSRSGTASYLGKCLYGPNYGGVPQTNCVQASTTEPDGVYRKYTISDVSYYILVNIEPELHDMIYPGEPVVITITYDGRLLVAGTHYNIDIKKKNESTGEYETVYAIDDEEGAYKVNIDGIQAKGYYGSKEYNFRFIREDEKWYNLENLIYGANDGDSIVLTHNYYGSAGDSVLKIDKNLIINLNGYTIDRGLTEAVVRGQVIRISAGNTVKIYNGNITGGYNKAKDSQSDPNSDMYDYKNDAGGIYNMGNLVLNNVHVVGNKCIKTPNTSSNTAAAARGGGIYTGRGSSLTMIGGTVSNNEARGGGGGVYCYMPASFYMKDVVVSGNTSESKGGGIRIRTANSVQAYMENCTIEKNKATETDLTRSSDGGGVYMQEGKLKMVTCTIGGEEGDGNQSAFAGAGFYQAGGMTEAINCTITNNSAYTTHDKMYGGGICVRAGTYLMDGGSITDNHSFRDGGGVYIYQGAHFQVKGEVFINDNFRTRPGADPQDSENNAYTDNNAFIEIVGPLTSNSKIHITGHGYGGVYTIGKEEWNVPDSLIVPDGKYQLVTVDEEGQEYPEVVLAPYYWYDAGSWGEGDDQHYIPEAHSQIVINKVVELHPGDIGYADSIKYVNGSIIIKDGAQLIISGGLKKNSPPAEALIEKKIKAFDDENGGWYAISIPTEAVKIWDLWERNTNLVEKASSTAQDPNMDLLRYDEPTHFWDSYNDISAHQSMFGDFTNTENGRGYLYRNRNDRDLSFYGCINLGEVTYKVRSDCNNGLKGWNLIGNPYCHGVYKGAGTAIPNGELLKDNFYILTKAGGWIPGRDNIDSIGVCQGILVNALATGDLVMNSTVSKGSNTGKRDGEKSAINSIKFVVSNNNYEDIAYAMFKNGYSLDKIDHINEDIPKLYINQDGNDYAIATMDKGVTMFNLNFKANKTGCYTLSVNPDGEFGYIHLIDKLADLDIDILKEGTYEFAGSIGDSDDRFVVCLGPSTSSGTFVYQIGNDIVVNGTGELQVFDVTGRRVMTRQIHGVETCQGASLQTGVYIFRLEGKTQKIVVR